MSLDDVVQHYLDDPNNNDGIGKDSIRSLMTSHLATGMKLQQQGLLREAIEEFAKENNRPIHADIDKEIAEKSYVHMGVVYRKLGDLENAKVAFQKAHELWHLYGLGSAPHYDLAEILIEQGQLDEAIAVCQELLEQIPRSGIKHLLAKALEMKKNKSE
jgi:tetratricopeptide (TPR) repeat protein